VEEKPWRGKSARGTVRSERGNLLSPPKELGKSLLSRRSERIPDLPKEKGKAILSVRS